MKVQNNKMKLKLKENENELEIISENDLFQPKFFFEVSTDTIFYNETEYFHFLESCISNLQFLFKISKQKSLSFLQKNNYDLCETIKELNELKKKNMDEKYVVQQTNNSEKNLLEVDFCLICEESKPQQFGIECSHKFCEECYKNYLKAIMENKGFLCFPAKCPMEGCNVIFYNFAI